MTNSNNKAEVMQQAGSCLQCGERVEAGAGDSRELCPECEKQASLPMSHYYLSNYYAFHAD